MPLCRFRLLLLTAFLLLGQLGGMVHGLSHHDGEKERPHAACQLCGAYSAFDHAAAGKLPAPVAGQSYTPTATQAPVGLERLICLPYSPRAPPLLA